jgi:hypothetical protein
LGFAYLLSGKNGGRGAVCQCSKMSYQEPHAGLPIDELETKLLQSECADLYYHSGEMWPLPTERSRLLATEHKYFRAGLSKDLSTRP